VALVRAALPKRSAWKRHVPVALFLLGLSGMGVAAARPQSSALVPVSRTSIILAMDVSRSMCSTDVAPNRLTVAQQAARKFVENQPKGSRIGVVAFSGFAELVVPPTNDRAELLAAIDGFTTGRGTAIGSATLKSLEALSAINPDVAPVNSDELYGDEFSADPFDPFDPAPEPDTPTTTAPVTPPEDGYVPDIIVLLTDGANTRGITPLDAAKLAQARRVRVYTIGFGSEAPAAMVCSNEQLGGDAFGSFGGGGGGFDPTMDPNFGGGFPAGGGGFRRFQVIDVETLTGVAELTGGQFYLAEDANQLQKVFADLPRQVVRQRRDIELSAGFAAGGAALAGLAMVLSLLWNRSP
jgi:Ca-activated chloride channel family protein